MGTDNITLRPCPFCNGKAVFLNAQMPFERARHYFVACSKCGVETPRTSRSRIEAAQRWNMRRKGGTVVLQAKVKNYWIEGDYGESLKLACSSCGAPFEYRTSFCPDCGAKMEEGNG